MALCRKPFREFLKAKGIINGTDEGLYGHFLHLRLTHFIACDKLFS